MFKQTQRSFAGGWLDRQLMGRTDLAKYYTGASKVENFVVRRQGGLAKRRGTGLCAKIKNLLGKLIDRNTGEASQQHVGSSRLVPLVYEREVGYYALLTGRRAFLVGEKGVYHLDGTWRRDVGTYYEPQIDDGTCDAADAECFVEDIPYSTLKLGMQNCPPGRTVRLAKDVATSSKLTCRGVVDLNGHRVTMTSYATWTFSGGTTVGIIDSAHANDYGIWWAIPGGGNFSRNVKFIVAENSDLFLMDGVTVSYPFTGSKAALVHLERTVGAARFEHCIITAAAGYGIAHIEGSDADESHGVAIVECDFATYDPSFPMFRNAVSNGRKLVIVSGYMDCAGAFAARNVLMKGGAVRCSTLGGTASQNTSVVAGLLSYSVDSSLVASGSELKGTTPDPEGGTALYNYNLASEGAYVYERSPVAPTPPAPLGRDAPYDIDVPYEDGDLASLDTYQSGDTVFIAHKNYPPAKLTFRPDEMKLGFEVIEFDATTWKRPRITAVSNNIHPTTNETSVQSGTTYTTTTSYTTTSSQCTRTVKVYKGTSQTPVTTVETTLPVRKVQYAVTYVKDGIESAPSNPVTVTYGAPWEQGGVVKLTFDRGDNAEDPDYYNIYKKEYTDFGLIGSTAQSSAKDILPEVSNVTDQGVLANPPDPSMYPTGSFGGAALARTDARDVLAPVDGSVVTSVESRVVGGFGAYGVFRGVGGAEFADVARLSFGDQSAAAVSSVKVWCDCHSLEYSEDPATGRVKVYERIFGTGRRITAKVTYKNKTGSQTTSTQTVKATLDPISYTPEGGGESTASSEEVVHYCGAFAAGTPAVELRRAIAREPRSATLEFGSVTADKQVVSVDMWCDDVIETTAAEAAALTYETAEINAVYMLTTAGTVGGRSRTAGTYLKASPDYDTDPVALDWIEIDEPLTIPVRVCGLELGFASDAGTTFEDDYVTPNMSITPPSQKASFRGRGNYPSCVGIYQQRLMFAASANQPATFWMSATGDLYTFAPHPSIREDDALEATLAATEFPNVNHIVMGHDILMFGDGGEWKIAPISGNAITYKTISATLQSSIGSAKWLKPIVVGNEVLFAERTGATLRAVSYNYVSDGYDSQDLTVLAGGMFDGNRIERMCYKQHPDSTIVCALADGTIAALVYMREHEVVAWSRHVLGGGWLAKDVATNKALDGTTTEVMLTVALDGELELWTGRPDSPETSVAAQACLDGLRQMTGAEASAQGAWQYGWVAVDLLTGEVFRDAAGLDPERSYAVGWTIRSELVTVRPEPSPDQTIQFEIKNLKSVELRTIAAGKFAVRSFAAPSGVRATGAQVATPVVDGALELVGKDVSTTVMGANSGDGRVQIVQEDVWPMSILQLSANYEIQPLSGSEG